MVQTEKQEPQRPPSINVPQSTPPIIEAVSEFINGPLRHSASHAPAQLISVLNKLEPSHKIGATAKRAAACGKGITSQTREASCERTPVHVCQSARLCRRKKLDCLEQAVCRPVCNLQAAAGYGRGSTCCSLQLLLVLSFLLLQTLARRN